MSQLQMRNTAAPEAMRDQMRPKGLHETQGTSTAGGKTGLETCNARLEFLFGLSSFPSGTFIWFLR